MSTPAHAAAGSASTEVVYPESDGQPMADNTQQFAFIHTVKGNLDVLCEDFVAGDHLWYPVEGHPEIRVAPDVYVAVGRPKGHRGSYRQWEEDDVPLTVVFEWWSPSNGFADQLRKHQFYDRHGVDEFYAFDQVRRELTAFHRADGSLQLVPTEDGVHSPRLGIRLQVVGEDLHIWGPDGRPFLSMTEMDAARRRAEEACARAEEERARAEEERARASARAEALAARLRELGVDPDA